MKSSEQFIGIEKKILGASQVALVVRKPLASAGDIRDTDSVPRVWKIPWRRAWEPTPVFLPGESHGQSSLVGYSPRGHKEAETTERLSRSTAPDWGKQETEQTQF